MTIDQILEIENENWGSIHLFASGIFFRAFERSALAFLDIANFHVTKKHSVKLNIDYIYIGFPVAHADRILVGRNYTKLSEDHIVVEARNVTLEELASKKRGYVVAQIAKTNGDASTVSLCHTDKCLSEVAALIEAFDVEKSTPLMCQNFLSIVKQKMNLHA